MKPHRSDEMFQAMDQMVDMQREKYYEEYKDKYFEQYCGMMKLYNLLTNFDEEKWDELKKSNTTEEWIRQYLED